MNKTPDELIQLLRTTKIQQFRETLDYLQSAYPEYYGQISDFIQSANQRPIVKEEDNG